MESRALVVVSFGTSHPETREVTIGAIERELAAAFPDREFFRAWTSSVIRRKIGRETGEKIGGVKDVLEHLADSGVSDVLVQPTHLLCGVEYDEMYAVLRGMASSFRLLTVGRPLLSTPEDRRRIAREVMREAALPEEDALVWMGHGTKHRVNEVYDELRAELRKAGGPRVFLGTVEGGTDLDSLIEQVRASGPARVWIEPFLIVAGEHAVKDMAGDRPDSWVNRFRRAGLRAEGVVRGLGEFSCVRALLTEHAKEAEPVRPE